MLLQRLVDYAGRDEQAKPFHRSRQFQWQLRLDKDGRLLSRRLESLMAPDAKGRPRGADHVVPAAVRTVGSFGASFAAASSWRSAELRRHSRHSASP